MKLSSWISFYVVLYDEFFIDKFSKCGKSILLNERNFKHNLDLTLEDYHNGKNKELQTFKIPNENIKNIGDSLIVIAYFNFSLIKSEDQLNMFNNSSIKAEKIFFILINKYSFKSY